MGLRSYLRKTNEKAKANVAEAKRQRGIEPDVEPTTLVRQMKHYKNERDFKKDRKKLAKKGWQVEMINNQGRPGWSKVMGGPLVSERYEVTYVKEER